MAHRPPGGAHGFVSIGILWRAFMFIVSNIMLGIYIRSILAMSFE